MTTYLRAILDHSPESIVLIGKNHEVLAFNKTMREVLFQYFNREVKEGDLYFPDFVIEPKRALYLQAFEQAMAGTPFYVQDHTKGDNADFYFDYSMRPVFDGDELLGVTLVAKDITREKLAELKIIDISEKLKAILDNIDESVTLLDMDYKILSINQIALANFQHNTQVRDVIGRDFRDFMPDKKNLFYTAYPKALAGEASNHEIAYTNVKGQPMWYQTRFNPVYDEQRQQIGVSIFAKDISERKLLEQSLKESEERFRKITAIAPIGIIITDSEFQIDYINVATRNLLGYGERELNGQPITRIVSDLSITGEHRLRVDNLALDINTPIFNQERFVALTKAGKPLNILLSSSTFLSKQKQLYTFIIQDITDLNQKNYIIAEQTSRLRDIAWYQSHIIRAPLSRIMGVVALLEENDFDPSEIDFLYKAILDSSHELDQVVKDIVQKTNVSGYNAPAGN